MRGDYQDVLHWCPIIMRDADSDPRLSDWCMFGLPAAMWLSTDFERALGVARTVCVDAPTGRVRASEEFRRFYVSEIVRWISLPMRAQKRDDDLLPQQVAALETFGKACEVDPAETGLMVDTTIETQLEVKARKRKRRAATD